MARHFAEHRAFYRSVLTSSCAFALNKALTGLLIPHNRELIHEMSGGAMDAQAEEDFATFLTGGSAEVVNTWVVEGADPLDPDQFADRLMRLAAAAALLPQLLTTTATTPLKGRKP